MTGMTPAPKLNPHRCPYCTAHLPHPPRVHIHIPPRPGP